jgi:hypothetical protein
MDGDVSMISFDCGAVTQKIVLGRDEQLAIINGSWLHDVSSSDFEQSRRDLTREPDMDRKEGMAPAQILGGCAAPP